MRHSIFCACLVLILACAYCPAQSDQSLHFEVASTHFEVASIKSATRPGIFSGGPGSERATYGGTTLETLIATAYDLGLGQVAGPSWIYTDWWALTVKLPPGTTADQFRQMLANLLAERFGLVIHRVTKEVIGYELTVAPGGPKLTPAKPEPGVPGMSWDCQKDGNTTHMTFRRTTMAFLDYQVKSILSGSGPDETIPVIDRTGLTGNFDFDLEIPTNGVDPSNISNALGKQLGLKLNPAKAWLSYIFVDHVKAPTAD